MATSFYVYSTLKEYQKVYGDKANSEMFQTKIKDMYVADGEKLWVVTNFTEQAAKPQLNRSIVHFYAGEVAYYKKGDEKLVLEGKHGKSKKESDFTLYNMYIDVHHKDNIDDIMIIKEINVYGV